MIFTNRKVEIFTLVDNAKQSTIIRPKNDITVLDGSIILFIRKK